MIASPHAAAPIGSRRCALRRSWSPCSWSFAVVLLVPTVAAVTPSQSSNSTPATTSSKCVSRGEAIEHRAEHLIPLSVGGSPHSPKNLWPEKYKGVFGARVKDKLERFLHTAVCKGTVRLAKARKLFRDWKAAFKRYDL
jgi:hypothetical protein